MSSKGGLLGRINPSKKIEDETEIETEDIEVGNMTQYNDELDGVPALLALLRLGTNSQKHDAAKAVGYIGKLGQMPAGLKIEAKNVIVDILQNEYPTMTNAFAMAEALMRVDEDAFWTLVMSWYGQSTKSVPNAIKRMNNSS